MIITHPSSPSLLFGFGLHSRSHSSLPIIYKIPTTSLPQRRSTLSLSIAIVTSPHGPLPCFALFILLDNGKAFMSPLRCTMLLSFNKSLILLHPQFLFVSQRLLLPEIVLLGLQYQCYSILFQED